MVIDHWSRHGVHLVSVEDSLVNVEMDLLLCVSKLDLATLGHLGARVPHLRTVVSG